MTAPSQRPSSLLSPGDRESELAALVLLFRLKIAPADDITARLMLRRSAVEVLREAELESVMFRAGTDDVDESLRAVEDWTKRKLDVRTVFDPTYPSNLRTIHNNPALVFVKGKWKDVEDSRSVAVVGTRKASSLGLKRARAAGEKLAAAGITVLSGLALGIDTAAHEGALNAGGRTAAVMGTGIDRVYPRENVDLAARIVKSGGALISQFFPEQPPTQWTFPMRNVVMSGLSIATLVIEASATSGAKSQARHALEHGRTVFLPKSLVEEHEWAMKMVDVGVKGVRAVQIARAEDIVERIVEPPRESALAI